MPGRESTFARGIPSWRSTTFLRTARSLIEPPHLPQMLRIPAVRRRCAEPYSTPLSPGPAADSQAPSQAQGTGMARLPRMSPRCRKRVTQPCPSPVSGGPCGSGCCLHRVAALRAAKVQANRGKRRHSSSLVAPRTHRPPLGFSLNHHSCQCLRSLQQQACSGTCPWGSTLLPAE